MAGEGTPFAPEDLHFVVMGGADGVGDPGNVVRARPPRKDVVAFTDARPAGEFAARLNEWGGSETPFAVYRPASPQELVRFLVDLERRGDRVARVDPAPGSVQRISLRDVLRAALRAAGADPDSIKPPPSDPPLLVAR